MANSLVLVGNTVIVKERFNKPVRTPINTPQKNLKLWRGRLGVTFAIGTGGAANTTDTPFLYDDDAPLPLATLSGDAITAGALFSMGCKRKTDLISLTINNGKMYGVRILDTGGTIDAAATANTYTRTASVWTVTPTVGEYILVNGFVAPANNGWHLVTAVSTTVITVAEALVTESGGADEIIYHAEFTPGGANVALGAEFDMNLLGIRLMKLNVTTAGTNDHFEEVADSADLTASGVAFATVGAWCDVQAEFLSSDGT